MILIGLKLHGTHYSRLEEMMRANGVARTAVQIRERCQVLMKHAAQRLQPAGRLDAQDGEVPIPGGLNPE